MNLPELSPVAGSTQAGKRKGRGIGYGNGKQLVHRLNMFQISPNQFVAAVEQIKREENDE